jgi:hypothetical protein
MYQPNQIDTIIKNATYGLGGSDVYGNSGTSGEGRPATSFEMEKYKTASPQTMAGLKTTFSKLNPNSISDYLTSIGQDSSLRAREELGKKYGIANVGTAEGNTALLKALKSKTPPPDPKVQGAIVPPVPTAPSPNTAPITAAPQGNQDAIKGSISDAATPPQTVDTDTNVVTARQNKETAYTYQQQAQQGLAALDAQIKDINLAVEKAMQGKRDEIARSGGVVDESQLRSLVTAENAPLLSQRSELMTQRGQYVTQYTQANNAYQKALADVKDAESNFFKTAQLGQGQQKIENQQQQFETKTGIQQSQFEENLKQRNIKYLKFIDPDTNVTYYLDPSTGKQITENSINNIPTTSSGGAASDVNNVSGIKNAQGFVQYDNAKASFDATVNDIKGKQTGNTKTGLNASSTLEDFVNIWINGSKGRQKDQGYTADDVAKILGVTKDTPIGGLDTTRLAGAVAKLETGYDYKADSFPGGTGQAQPAGVYLGGAFNANDASIPDKASLTTPIKELDNRTPLAIIQNASAYAMQGGNLQQFVGGLSAKDPRTQRIKNAIDNKATAMASSVGTTLDQLRKNYKADTKVASDLAPRVAFTAAAANTAGDNLKLALEQSPSVGRTDSAFMNSMIQKYQSDFTKAKELTKFEVYIYTAAREYAKVTSGSAQSVSGLTDTQTKASELLLSAKQSPEAFQAATEAMIKDMGNVQGRLLEQVSAQSSFQNVRDFTALLSKSMLSNAGTSSLNSNDLDFTLKQSAGKDGFVSPQDWKTLEDMYIQSGGDQVSFTKEYGKYKNPNNQNYAN